MPPAQRSLFDGPDVAPLVHIEVAPRVLSRNQRLFNRLTKRLRELRAEVAAWQRSVDRYWQRAAAEIEPLQRELRAGQREAVVFIDALLASSTRADRLTRVRRARLQDILVTLAEGLLQSGPDDEIEAMLNRHSGLPGRDRRRVELDLAEAMLGEVLGDEFVAGHSATTVDELLAHAGERVHARLEAEAEQRRQRAERRREQQNDPAVTREREASQSVREVFRRLAAAVHPDREPDATERARKTALMQRVNQAYGRGDLLELLTVQMEIEQIDSRHLAQASEERLGHYCAVLREQERALQGELARIQAPFRAALDGSSRGCNLRPRTLDALIDRDVQALRETMNCLKKDMGALRDPLRRAALLDDIEHDDDEDEAIEAILLAAALSRARPGRRKKRTRRRR